MGRNWARSQRYSRLVLSQLFRDYSYITDLGVVEHGLFINRAKIAYFGNEDGSVSSRESI